MKSKEDIRKKIEYLCSYYESYSCSESVWRILTDVYDEMVSAEFLRIGSINRGGACAGGRCGVLESAMAFLSYVYGREGPENDYRRLEYWAEKIHMRFIEVVQFCDCDEIWSDVCQKIRNGTFVPKTHCIISESLIGISDVIYEAYVDLKCHAPMQKKDAASRGETDQTAMIKRGKGPTETCREYLKQGYLCSEAALRALLDELGIEWTDKEKRIATIYQKGGAMGDRCGVVEVTLLILGYRYGRLDCCETNLQDRLLARRLQERVKSEMGSCVCRELTDLSEDIERHCPKLEKILEISAGVLADADSIIENELELFEV